VALDGYAPNWWRETVDDEEPHSPAASGSLHLEDIEDPDVHAGMGKILQYLTPPDRSWLHLVLDDREGGQLIEVAQNILVSPNACRLTDIWLLSLDVQMEKPDYEGAPGPGMLPPD
jgi:hypothetical protein